MQLNKTLFVCLFFTGLLLIPATAQPTGALSAEQQAAVQVVVKDYLLKNPEIIQEALIELDRRQQVAQEAAQKNALNESRQNIYDAPGAIVAGNPKGDVTLVEFFDYNCGFCKKSVNDVQSLMKSDPKLRVILKDFPVLGPESVEASRVALAAKKQLKADQVWEFHSKVMNLKGRVTGERTLQVAKEMGLDTQKIQNDINSAEIKSIIEANVKLGDQLSLTGTPAFIIGDEVIFGAVGAESLGKTIANVRKCGKASC